MRPVRVGMVGYGFMGKAHSHAYHDALAAGRPPSPDFTDGAACQAVMEAVLRAGRSKRWEAVEAV